MRRIPKDNLPGILWFMSQAKWDRGQDKGWYRNRHTFIELGLMAAHLTGGDTAPKGANLRTLGSAFGAAFGAICKLAHTTCGETPYPWTITFCKMGKIKSLMKHGANPTAGILAGPSNKEWRSARARTDEDIAAARLISEGMLGPHPAYRQALRRWWPDRETGALAYTARLLQEMVPHRVRVSTKRQLDTPPKAPPTARQGPCIFGCKFTHLRQATGKPRWDKVPVELAST